MSHAIVMQSLCHPLNVGPDGDDEAEIHVSISPETTGAQPMGSHEEVQRERGVDGIESFPRVPLDMSPTIVLETPDLGSHAIVDSVVQPDVIVPIPDMVVYNTDVASALPVRVMGPIFDAQRSTLTERGVEGDECIVCLSAMVATEEVTDFLPCGHTYTSCHPPIPYSGS